MGTNFYLVKGYKPNSDFNTRNSPKIHLGKRSAAGYYCWDCRQTLCREGNNGVHDCESQWYDVCPICGKKPVLGKNLGAAGKELGFTKPLKQKGVGSCCSFSWAMSHTDYAKIVRRGKPIQDEYGRKYSVKEFEQMLTDCPIVYCTSIGSIFS